MTRSTRSLLLLLALVSCKAPSPTTPPPPAADASKPAVPPTRREAIVDTIHGTKVADPYRWLEKADDPEVQQWMTDQDAAARAYLGALPDREAIRERTRALTYIGFTSPPSREGDRYFYWRVRPDQERGVGHYRIGQSGEERVLYDPNLLPADGSIAYAGSSVSPDGKTMAYELSINNADATTIHVRDIDSGKDSEIDVIEGVRFGSASWTRDAKGFVYPWAPADAPSDGLMGHIRVRYHALGTDPANDPVVVEPSGDPSVLVSAYISEDGRWLLIDRSRGEQNEVWFKDLRKKNGLLGPAKPLVTGMKAWYMADAHDGVFYVTTDEGAPRQHVFAVDPAHPQRERWTEIVPQNDDWLLGGYVVGGRLVTQYSHDAYTTMHVHELSGKRLYDIRLPSIGVVGGMSGRKDDDVGYFVFSSLEQVPAVYQTSISTGETTLWNRVELPVDTSGWETRQVWYPSKDGTKVSMFILAKKGIALDGSHPVLMYGYGGFAESMRPDFSELAVQWVERGGIYALPNLRGGGEYGEPWHQAGMLDKKQNVFDDFIAAAEYLVAQGYTSPQRLAIMGGSNGGLLVGAAMVQRPELFRAVVCSVPLLDMVRYPDSGIGRAWIPEYGDPANPEDFAVLHAYSPYHHVEPGTAYPALLMLSADSDDRVDPMHARKFVAAIQHASTSGHPAILRIERHAGHGGADVRSAGVEQSVDRFAFLFEQLGM